MILDKDSNNDIRSTESFIFMKLGNTTDVNGNDYDGHETIATYISDEKTRGYTWFSTQSLYYGMSQKRVENYNNSMVAGNKVTILFCFGENAGGKNDIAYTADVMEIVSYKIPTVFPTDDYPEDLRFCYHLHKVNRILRIYSVSMKPPGINSSIRNHNEIWIFSFCHILNSKHTQL